MDSLTNPPLTSSGLGAPFLQVLLIADPSLEGDAADDKADIVSCHQLGQVTVLQYV